MLKLHRDKNGQFKIRKFTILYFWRTYSNIYIQIFTIIKLDESVVLLRL